MPIDPNGGGDGDSLQQDAADWFSRMRAPDSGQYRPAFEVWLAENPGHRAAYDRIALRWQQADLLSHTPSGRERAGLPGRKRSARPVYALAACLIGAILIGISVWAWSGPRPGANAPRTEVAGSKLSSPVGIRRLRLSDGSFITLDTESSVTVRMTDGERRILLTKGRARFEVAHEATRPFIVSAGDGEVVATGTVFDVSLASGHPCVSLLKGSVEVRRRPAGSPEQPMVVRLVPGQSITLDGASPAPQRAPVADSAWASGMLVFEDAPLSQVLATANRYSRRIVSIEDPALGSLVVTGTFRADRPDELAATLAAAFGLEVVQKGDNLVLRRRSPT
jgi:transmembrane sensor